MSPARHAPRRAALALGTLALLAAGCGGGEKTYPVRGKVAFPDGKPLPGGWITFNSIGREPAVSADSEIRSDGTFELRTSEPGDGAPAGKYRVTVRPPSEGESEEAKSPPLIDAKFGDPTTSGIEITVEAKENELAVVVTPPEPRKTGPGGAVFDP